MEDDALRPRQVRPRGRVERTPLGPAALRIEAVVRVDRLALRPPDGVGDLLQCAAGAADASAARPGNGRQSEVTRPREANSGIGSSAVAPQRWQGSLDTSADHWARIPRFRPRQFQTSWKAPTTSSPLGSPRLDDTAAAGRGFRCGWEAAKETARALRIPLRRRIVSSPRRRDRCLAMLDPLDSCWRR